MRNTILLAAAAATLSLGAGAAQAQLIDGQALASSRIHTPARAGLGVQVVPGGHIMPRAGTREYAELQAQLYGPGQVDARARGSAYTYAPAPTYNYDPYNYDAYGYRYAPAGSYNTQPSGYYNTQQSYAAGSYVWVDNRGWVWVPQGAYLRADGSLGAAVSGGAVRSNLGGRVGGSIR